MGPKAKPWGRGEAGEKKNKLACTFASLALPLRFQALLRVLRISVVNAGLYLCGTPDLMSVSMTSQASLGVTI